MIATPPNPTQTSSSQPTTLSGSVKRAQGSHGMDVRTMDKRFFAHSSLDDDRSFELSHDMPGRGINFFAYDTENRVYISLKWEKIQINSLRTAVYLTHAKRAKKPVVNHPRDVYEPVANIGKIRGDRTT